MMNLIEESCLNELKEIYMYANTPLYLYEKFRDNNIVRKLSELDASLLAKEFESIGLSGIDKYEELVYEYAISIAFTLKSYEQAVAFFNKEGNINFEWFDDIRDLYFEKNKPTTTISIEIPTSNIKSKAAIHAKSLQSNDSVLEFNAS